LASDWLLPEEHAEPQSQSCTASKEESMTLEDKEGWEVVSREDWMKVPPSTFQKVSGSKCAQFEISSLLEGRHKLKVLISLI